MASQNLGAESQICDKSRSINDGAKVVGGPVDAVVAAADGGMMVELGSGRGGKEVAKKKRGRPPKAQAKPPPAKKNKEEEEEDVCFICFDGGSLVLCDRRCCPKAYHPACIKRDEEFFESAAKWNCGWHICSICQKAAHHLCYTCTYSLCKGCIRKADYVCVRGDKGFCTICMKTIMLIENNGQGEDGKVQADFDDKLSWEYLFKVYWVYLKGKLSLTLDELTLAKNPWKEASSISSPLQSTGVSMTSATSFANLEANESKRRKIDDEKTNIPPNENVNTEKPGISESKTMVGCKEWATKELLDFVAHMKNGHTSVLSRFDVHELVTEYINRNNLSDPKKNNQIICDSRLKNLFGKSRVGRLQMLKILEPHFFVKGDPRQRKVKSIEEQDDDEWNPDKRLTAGKSRKPRNRNKKLEEFAAVDVHNMNLIYLRRDMMESLLEDSVNFSGKVVGSIVRIRVSGSDQEHDMYRLVQVVDTSKTDVPYKIYSKSTDVMLEVLNLDKKETISIDTISDQEFSEEECRRLKQSIKCRLVKHFTVGEIQEKAVALQSVKLNDLTEKEVLRLNHPHDVASEKGHKKNYKECMEKLQLLKTPDEQDRRLHEIPDVHSDSKMNPEYESDDTEEYFNKEHGDHMESKYSVVSSKKLRSHKKRAGSSRKNEQPKNPTITIHPSVEEGSTKTTTFVKSQYEVDFNGSAITKSDHQATLSSSVTASAPEIIAPSPDGMVWHYRDPNEKIQGPFSLVQLQRWSTTGYFPTDMKIWAGREDQSLFLNDVLKERFGNRDVRPNDVLTERFGNVTVGSAIPNPVSLDKVSDSHGSSGGQNWTANNHNLNSNPPSVESTGQLNSSNPSKPEDSRIEADINDANANTNANTNVNAALFDLPGPTPKKMQSVLDSKLLIQDSGSNSSLVVDGVKLPVKREEFDSGLVIVAGDHVATPTSNIDQNVQPTCHDVPTWQDVSEMIEISALGEESVSDLLAEVDAMESQYGLPSPTSRRNSFVDDLFNDSFDEFSPTPDPGTRSDGFSSSGDIQLPSRSATTDEHINVFDFMKSSNSFISQIEIDGQSQSQTTVGIPQWPEMKRAPQGMIDINRSAKAEGDEGEMETKVNNVQVKVKVENGSYIQPVAPVDTCQTRLGSETSHGSAWAGEPMPVPKTDTTQNVGLEGKTNHRRTGGIPAKKERDGEFIKPEAPQPPPPLTLGLDPFEPHGLGNTGGDRNPNQSRNSRSLWNNKQSVSFGGGGGGNGGGLRPPSKGQQQRRVCRFYESGRCKKGASCKYLHS